MSTRSASATKTCWFPTISPVHSLHWSVQHTLHVENCTNIQYCKLRRLKFDFNFNSVMVRMYCAVATVRVTIISHGMVHKVFRISIVPFANDTQCIIFTAIQLICTVVCIHMYIWKCTYSELFFYFVVYLFQFHILFLMHICIGNYICTIFFKLLGGFTLNLIYDLTKKYDPFCMNIRGMDDITCCPNLLIWNKIQITVLNRNMWPIR